MNKIPEYYQRHEQKAFELVKYWLLAMVICVILSVIWALIMALIGA